MRFCNVATAIRRRKLTRPGRRFWSGSRMERIADGEDGFDIIDEYGLEPDYLEDLICW